ncbi:MAG: hypothetical protein GC184_13345 [Rhizobiales bacterium]|nr:hypothetical protein [Hyphomicrobiales bacterium]
MPALHNSVSTETYKATAPAEKAKSLAQKFESVRHRLFSTEVGNFIESDLFVAIGYIALAAYSVVIISSVVLFY